MSTSAAYQQNKAQAAQKRQQSEAVLQDVETSIGDSEEARRMGGG